MKISLILVSIMFSYVAMAANSLKLPCEYKSRKSGRISLEKAPVIITKSGNKLKFVNQKYSKAVSTDMSKITSTEVSITDIQACIKVMDETVLSKRYAEVTASKKLLRLFSAKSGKFALYFRPKDKKLKKSAAFMLAIAEKTYCLKKTYVVKVSKRLKSEIK